MLGGVEECVLRGGGQIEIGRPKLGAADSRWSLRAGGPHGGHLICALGDRPMFAHDMLARTTPEDGDIVVRQETREGRDVYVLHTAPGADQYLLRTRDEAVAQAVTFAKRQSVRAWFCGETSDVVLLNDSRVVESV
jgi:hypothetical protein